GVHLFWWTPHASEHSTAKGAGKFALTENRLVDLGIDRLDQSHFVFIGVHILSHVLSLLAFSSRGQGDDLNQTFENGIDPRTPPALSCTALFQTRAVGSAYPRASSRAL
ncbi:hypothetical protein, partial [Mesorhizobium sp. M0965]|uniref:hypothetical protein n=1 Tax=Mesorhizobium sp. M0965 TaxID=2957036 RepID=UPI0033393AD5